MNPISKAADIATFPVRTAVGIASTGVRTTVRLLGWAAEQAVGQVQGRTAPTVAAPERVADPVVDRDVDPMAPTREAPTTTSSGSRPTTRPKKVPASQVPLKSAPTPSLPAALDALDEADDAEPVPAAQSPTGKTTTKKKPAKKAAAKKAAAKRAPSKQAAVLAPALGLSEDEVEEVVTDVAEAHDDDR